MSTSGSGSSIISELTELIVVANQGNSSFVIQTDSIPALYIDKDAKVGINTLHPSSQLEVLSEDGSCIRIRNGESDSFADLIMESTGDVSINTGSTSNKVKTNGSVDIVNHNGSSIGLQLAGSLVEASAEELNFNKVTPGTASASKALVLDSSKNISGISSVSATDLFGNIQTGSQPNITSVGTLSSLNVANGVVASQLSGTIQTASQPNITSVGTLSSLSVTNGVSASQLTGTIQTAAQPNITSIGNLSSVTINGSLIGSEAAFLSGTVAGAAANSKALVLSSTGTISGITALSATSLAGTLQTASQPNITSIGTLTNLSVLNSIIANQLTGTLQTEHQPNIKSLGELSSISISGFVIGSEAAFLSGTVAGAAANSKALVLSSTGTISGITALSATRLTGILQTESQPNVTSLGNLSSLVVNGSTIVSEAAFLSGAVAGVAGSSKALVLSSTGTISGISSLSATNLIGTLQTSSQPNITSLGVLSSLEVNGTVKFNSTSDATSSTNASATFSGGVGIAKSMYVGAGIYGVIETASQPNITSLGTLASLSVNGQLNITGSITLNGVNLSAGGGESGSGPDYVLGITPGTALASKALVLDDQRNITGIQSLTSTRLFGAIHTPAQPRITSVGNLSSVTIANSMIRNEAAFLSGAVAGMGAESKVLVLDLNRNIGNINNMNVSTLNAGTILVNGMPLSSESVFTTDITPGVASAGKALVLDSNKDISGIRTLSSDNALQVYNSPLTNTITEVKGTTVWNRSSHPFIQSSKIAWSEELRIFALVPATGTTNAAHSLDGITWTNNLITAGTWRDIVWSKERGVFVAVGNGVAARSVNGINWVASSGSVFVGADWVGVCWSKEMELFVAVGQVSSGNQSIMTSPDGITWTRRASPGTGYRWVSVTWSPELGLFVSVAAVADSGSKIMRSSNGLTWTLSTDPISSGRYADVCWSSEKALFVATVYDNVSTVQKIITSVNGINWTIRETPPIATAGSDAIIWIPELDSFVASVINSQSLLLSNDGITWTLPAVPSIITSSGPTLSNFAWSPRLNLLVGVNSSFISYYSYNITKNTDLTYSQKLLQNDIIYDIESKNSNGGFTFNNRGIQLMKISNQGLTFRGTHLTPQMISTLEVPTIGAAFPSKVLTVDSGGILTNVTRIIVTESFRITGGLTLDTTTVGYINGLTPGTATANKALVTNSSNSISGIVNIGASTLTLGSVQVDSNEIAYIDGVTRGTASINKALVLDSSGNISGINNITITGSNTSTNTSSGALVVTGGVGIGGALFSGSINTTNLVANGTASITGLITSAGGMNVTNVVESTSISTGSIRTAGGVGIAKSLFVGALSNFAGDATFSARATFASTTSFAGSSTFASDVGITGPLTISSSTVSSSPASGALVVTGGLGVGGGINASSGISASSVRLKDLDIFSPSLVTTFSSVPGSIYSPVSAPVLTGGLLYDSVNNVLITNGNTLQIPAYYSNDEGVTWIAINNTVVQPVAGTIIEFGRTTISKDGTIYVIGKRTNISTNVNTPFALIGTITTGFTRVVFSPASNTDARDISIAAATATSYVFIVRSNTVANVIISGDATTNSMTQAPPAGTSPDLVFWSPLVSKFICSSGTSLIYRDFQLNSTWRVCTTPVTTGTVRSIHSNESAGVLFAVGENFIWYSFDGIQWFNAVFNALATGASFGVAINSSVSSVMAIYTSSLDASTAERVYYSNDGINWTNISVVTSPSITGVFHEGNNHIYTINGFVRTTPLIKLGPFIESTFYGFDVSSGYMLNQSGVGHKWYMDSIKGDIGEKLMHIDSIGLEVNTPELITDLTESTSESSGSLITLGGVGIAKSLNVGSSASADYIKSTRVLMPNGTDVGANFIGSLSETIKFGIGAHDTTGENLRIGISDSVGNWSTNYPNVYSGTFTSISDHRIKEDIVPIPYGLNEVKLLNPVKYHIKGNTDNVQIGFIAHEIQKVIPEVVKGTKDQVDINGNEVHQGVSYANLTALLIKAVQEQSEMIEELRKEVNELKNKQ